MSTDAYSTTIRINGGKGVELYLYHLGEILVTGQILVAL